MQPAFPLVLLLQPPLVSHSFSSWYLQFQHSILHVDKFISPQMVLIISLPVKHNVLAVPVSKMGNFTYLLPIAMKTHYLLLPYSCSPLY